MMEHNGYHNDRNYIYSFQEGLQDELREFVKHMRLETLKDVYRIAKDEEARLVARNNVI